MGKTCFMFGHRETPASAAYDLEKAIEEQYEKYGIREFVVGSRGRFDDIAAWMVKVFQTEHSDVRLTLLLPYINRKPPFSHWQYDGTLYLEGMENVPPRYAIVRSNQKMALKADTIICYVNNFGNARKLFEYVRRMKPDAIIENVAQRH